MRVFEIPLIPAVSRNGCSFVPLSFSVKQEERGRSLLESIGALLQFTEVVAVPEHVHIS